MNFLVIVLLFVVFLQTRIMDLRRQSSALVFNRLLLLLPALFPVLRMARVFIFMLRDC